MKNGPLKRGRVMQIYARDHIEVHTQKKKEVLYLVKKKRKEKQKNLGEIGGSRDQLSESDADSQCCHLKCMYIVLQRRD